MRKLSFYLLKAVLFPFSKLPPAVHRFNARWIAWLLKNVFRYRYSDVVTNISRSFPDMQYDEIKRVTGEFYLHFADLITETIWFGGCRNPKRLRKARIMEIRNPETVAELYEKAPGIMVLYSHCGNWELYGGIENYNYSDVPMPINENNFCVVYRQMHSAVWDRILHDNRFAPLHDRKNFKGYIESKLLVRYAFTHREDKKIYNVNTDQRPYYEGSGNLEVTFMGQSCRTMSAAAAIARKFGFAVCFLKMSIKSRGHYELEYIPITEDATGMSVREIMDRYYRLLEDEIREQPYNYLWTHHRWWRG